MAYLERKGVDIIRHDLAKDPPSRKQLEAWIDDEHPEEFLNKRSPAFKERNLAGKKLTKKQVIDLVQQDPNLIRRPVVLGKGKPVFGDAPDEYDRL